MSRRTLSPALSWVQNGTLAVHTLTCGIRTPILKPPSGKTTTPPAYMCVPPENLTQTQSIMAHMYALVASSLYLLGALAQLVSVPAITTSYCSITAVSAIVQVDTLFGTWQQVVLTGDVCECLLLPALTVCCVRHSLIPGLTLWPSQCSAAYEHGSCWLSVAATEHWPWSGNM